MTKTPSSDNNSVLRAEILSDRDLLEAEMLYAGCVRVIAAWRYKARLQVEEEIWNFDLKRKRRLEAVGGSSQGNPVLRRLAFHRAAEVMLALRLGHEEWSKEQQSENEPESRRPEPAEQRIRVV